MIIGDNKDKVIENIRKAIIDGDLNRKVEINDPNLTFEEQEEIINEYLENRKKISFKSKNEIARSIISVATKALHKDTEIVGIENAEGIKTGAIITSNHFNPLDTTIIQKLIKKLGKRKLYIVTQVTNLAMDGAVGFMMNYSDTIPIDKDQANYMGRYFPSILKERLNKKHFILIYPEEEMWFNYRKPRTLKPGAYYFAARNNVPVISCFTEMIDTDEEDNKEFYKVKYVLHVLPPIYPDPKLSPKENSIIMMEKDYTQKKDAYEKAYGKKLDYTFESDDIAGLINKEELKKMEELV